MIWFWFACGDVEEPVMSASENVVESTKQEEGVPQLVVPSEEGDKTEEAVGRQAPVYPPDNYVEGLTGVERELLLDNLKTQDVGGAQTIARGIWELYEAEPNLWYRDMEAQQYFLDHFYEGVSFESNLARDYNRPFEDLSFCIFSDRYGRRDTLIDRLTWKQYPLLDKKVFLDVKKSQVVVSRIAETELVPVFVYLNNRRGEITSIAISPTADSVVILEDQHLLILPLSRDSVQIHTTYQNAEIVLLEQSKIRDVQWTEDGIFVFSNVNERFHLTEDRELVLSEIDVHPDEPKCDYGQMRKVTVGDLSSQEDFTFMTDDSVRSVIIDDKAMDVPLFFMNANQFLFQQDQNRLLRAFGKTWLISPGDIIRALPYSTTVDAFVTGEQVWSCHYDGCDVGSIHDESLVRLDYQFPFVLNERLLLLYSRTQNKLSVREAVTGHELFALDRPTEVPTDVHVSLDEKWLFLEMNAQMLIYSMVDGSLLKTCSLEFSSAEVCTFQEYRTWQFPFGELLGEFSRWKSLKNTEEIELRIVSFEGFNDSTPMSKGFTEYQENEYWGEPLWQSHRRISWRVNEGPFYFYIQFVRDGRSVNIRSNDSVWNFDLNTQQPTQNSQIGSVNERDQWKSIQELERFEEVAPYSELFALFAQSDQPLRELVYGPDKQWDGPIHKIRNFTHKTYEQYKLNVGKGQTVHDSNEDSDSQTIELRSLSGQSPSNYYVDRFRHYLPNSSLQAYRHPPSHQAYYEQTNRFSLERICPSTLQVVTVKPADQNLDSAFVPKRLWATYCG